MGEVQERSHKAATRLMTYVSYLRHGRRWGYLRLFRHWAWHIQVSKRSVLTTSSTLATCRSRHCPHNMSAAGGPTSRACGLHMALRLKVAKGDSRQENAFKGCHTMMTYVMHWGQRTGP